MEEKAKVTEQVIEMVETLVGLDIAVVRDGKYVYSPEFEKTVEEIKKNRDEAVVEKTNL